MEWGQVLTIIGANVALIGVLSTVLIWVVNKNDAELKSIGNRLDGHAQRIDQLYRMFVDEIKAQGSRTDRLYEMFVDLLKDRK